MLGKNIGTIELAENEAKIFARIAEIGPCSSTEVADGENADLLLVMRLVHKLEAQGLLVRTKIGRRCLFAIKPRARKLVAKKMMTA